MTIEEFITARLDEDEATCRFATMGPWRPEEWPIDHGREFLVVSDLEVGAPAFAIKSERDAQHIARHDPARVLRDVAAKRRILNEYRAEVGRGPAGEREDFQARHNGILAAYGVCVRALATIWSDHPDYRPEWTPVAVP